jgi:hypothetical protein
MSTLKTVLMKACLTTAAIAIGSHSAFAYKLYTGGGCTSGKKWNTSTPVQVKLLYDSFIAYEDGKGINDFFTRTSDLLNLLNDVNEVVDEYNSAYGIDIRLEVGTAITGDDNLDDSDDFGDHTIVIGFTDEANDNPAWTPTTDDGSCTYLQTHLFVNKKYTWNFGVPADLTVDGKYSGGAYFFRSILLHEMGHALGLSHPETGYAVMDHGTKVWTRGKDDTLRVELLPDDIAGLRALYGNGGLREFDISVTNTWYLPETEYPTDAAAHQINICTVSSRGDDYFEPTGTNETGLCGVNFDTGSKYPPVSDHVCPGKDLQIRYALNNRSDQTVTTEEQVWLSADDDLEVNGAAMDSNSRRPRAGRSSPAAPGSAVTTPSMPAPRMARTASTFGWFHTTPPPARASGRTTPTSGTTALACRERSWWIRRRVGRESPALEQLSSANIFDDAVQACLPQK